MHDLLLKYQLFGSPDFNELLYRKWFFSSEKWALLAFETCNYKQLDNGEKFTSPNFEQSDEEAKKDIETENYDHGYTKFPPGPVTAGTRHPGKDNSVCKFTKNEAVNSVNGIDKCWSFDQKFKQAT